MGMFDYFGSLPQLRLSVHPVSRRETPPRHYFKHDKVLSTRDRLGFFGRIRRLNQQDSWRQLRHRRNVQKQLDGGHCGNDFEESTHVA